MRSATDSYRAEGKTDAHDAAIIAYQTRMRRDLQPLRPGNPLIGELRMLTAHRSDLAIDRTRAINRLRARLVAIQRTPARRAFSISSWAS